MVGWDTTVLPCAGKPIPSVVRKTMTIRGALICTLLVTLLLPGHLTWAEAKPKIVVEQYCKLDYDGARIGIYPGLAKKISPLVTWRVEPGWDSSVVISSYTVGEAAYDGEYAKVVVEYSTVGRFEGNSPMIPDVRQEKAEFRLVRNGTDWLIEAINGELLLPHVSISAKIINLELILNQSVGEPRRKVLLADVEKLRKVP